MGTNYYALIENTEYDDLNIVKSLTEPMCLKLHIGKSSGGWCFLVEIHQELNINSWEDWKDKIESDLLVIVDEYNDLISFQELKEIVENRYSEASWEERELRLMKEYTSLDSFLESNCAVKGPNNLLRHKYAKPGNGTWSCIEGEFC
jgi:hypothetical protein